MLIKMLCGTYGANENGIIVAKTNKSAPFYVEEKRGRELIASGYAKEVNGMLPAEDDRHSDAGEDHGKENVGDDLDNYSAKDLQKLAKEMGLSAGGSKKEIIDRIRKSREEKEDPTLPDEEPALPDEEPDGEDEGDRLEESPLLTAAEPEA